LTGAAFGSEATPYDAAEANTMKTGVLRFTTENIKRYLRVVPHLDGDWVEFAANFIFIGGQYLNQDGPSHTFVV
jgi:hypothetical protein